MSNKSRLQTNNTNIQALIDKANSLPDAGSGGGAALETCTVTMAGTQPSMIVGTIVNNGTSTPTNFMPTETSLSIVKNSLFVVVTRSARERATPSGNASSIISYATTYAFNITGDATITIS